MSKYTDYGEFMVAVLEKADEKCYRHSLTHLVDHFHLYGTKANVMKIIIKLFEIGWPSFVAVCALLVLGPIAFIAALTTFVLGGVGAIVIAGLAIYGGINAIKLLYANKTTPLKILQVGREYKPRFDAHIGQYSYIDSLIDEAADKILS